MIRLDVEQGSASWFAARTGLPTASRFSEIITAKTLKLSNSCERYAHELIASQILGYDVQMASSGFMARGTELEAHAVDYYEMQHDCETEKVGFILRDDRRVGCSPDRFVGTEGLLEIKCPSAAVHLGYLLDESIGYNLQVQGQLWLTERQWCDTVSYNPDMPCLMVREERSEPTIKAIAAAVDQFLSMIDDKKAALAYRGYFPGLVVPPLKLVATEAA